MSTNLLLRLGLALSGTNLDLEKMPSESDSDESDGDSDGDSGDKSDDESDGDSDGSDGESGDDEGDESDGKGSGEGEGDDAGEDESGGSGEGEGDDAGEDGKPGDGDGDGDSDGEGEPGDGEGEDGEGESKDGKGKPGKKGGKQPRFDSGDGEGTEGDDEHQGGGYDPGDGHGLSQSIIDAWKKGVEADLKDNNGALGEAVDGKKGEEDASCKAQEQVWRPYEPDKDTVNFVTAGPGAKQIASNMRQEVRPSTSALRNRMRTKFLLARQPKITHGVRSGRGLSERRLVGSLVELRSGVRPTRPDWRRETQQAVTLAAGVVIDESYSMRGSLQVGAARGALVIADAMDLLGSPCQVVGPRDGTGGYGWGHNYGNSSHPPHRTDPVRIDMFKDWNEPMTQAFPRFGNVKADGGTPLSDGIQYSLQELNLRTERFRVCMVITDGCPNNQNVVRRQIRLAAEAGVFVIGIAIGGADRAVKRLFPLNCCVRGISSLPQALMGVLEQIVFPKRGKKITLDGLRR